jgi:Ca2+/Na+ antiporter
LKARRPQSNENRKRNLTTPYKKILSANPRGFFILPSMILLQQAIVGGMLVISVLITGFVIGIVAFVFLFNLKEENEEQAVQETDYLNDQLKRSKKYGVWLLIAFLLFVLMLIIYWLSNAV